MTRRWITGGALMILILIVIGALCAGGPARAQDHSRPSAPARAEDRASPGTGAAACDEIKEHDRALWLLFQYIGLPPRPAADPRAAERDLMGLLARRRIQVEYVVATVPDPLAAGLGGFDQTLDSLTLALEVGQEFRLDRYGFPWQFTEDPENRGQMKVTVASCLDGEPGVVLYRAGSIDHVPPVPERLLLLFLVPERPTSGIHKAAFYKALAEIRALHERDLEANRAGGTLVLDEKPAEPGAAGPDGPDGRSGVRRLRIIGPGYSGAAISLRHALQEALEDQDEQGRPIWRDYLFDIISGSASRKSIQTLLEISDQDHVRRTRFRATVLPDIVLEAAMRTYLQRHLQARPEEIAVLTESTTSYGQGLIDLLREPPPGPSSQPPPGPPSTGARRSAPLRSIATPLVLPFPMHISRLASDWAQEEKERRKEEARDRTSSRSPTGALPHRERFADRPDLLPSAAPRETSTSEDLALTHILNSIAVGKVHYVGLYATLTDDKRFLARQIHRFAPDVVLFTVGADLLYTHPDDRDSFSGMLVASTYPLFSKNQQSCYPQPVGRRQCMQFSDEAAQGKYNAMLAHLGSLGDLLEYASPLPGPLDGDGAQRREHSRSRPAAWISVVGNGALVPFHFEDQYEDGGFVYEPAAPKGQQGIDRGRVPEPFDSGIQGISMLVLGLWCLLHCVAFFWRPFGPKDDALPRPMKFLEVFHCPPDVAGAGRPWLYLLACFGALLMAYSGIFALYAGRLAQWPSARWGAAVLAAAGWGLLWLVVLRLLLRPWLRLPALGRLRWPVAGAWIGAVVLGCQWGVLHLQRSRGFQAYSLYFAQRAEYPGYGLSLLLPFLLLCGVLYFWGLSQLDRMHLLNKARHLGVVEPHGVNLTAIEDSLKPYASGRLPREYSVALWSLLSLTCYYFIFRVLTLDHWVTNWIFRGLILLAVACITFGFARFHAMWHHIRALLRQLGSQPLAEAYRRVPEPFSRPLGMQIVEDLPQEVEIEALRVHLSLIRNHLGQVLSPPPPAAAGAQPGRSEPGLAYLREKLAGPLTGLKVAADKLQMDAEQFEEALRTCKGGLGTSKNDREKKENLFYQFSEAVVATLKLVWQGRPLSVENEPLLKEVAAARSTYDAYLRYLPDGGHVLLRLMEDFIAIQGVIYVRHLFLHLRNLLTFVTASMLCLIGAVSLYPFQPHHLLMVLIGLIVVPVVAVFVLVFTQMSRNEVLSRIAGTRPGKVDLDRSFLTQVAVYAVVPLLGLAAAQFPLFGGYILSWLEPVLRPLAK